MAKYCASCGKELDENAKFCSGCGAEVNFTPAATEQTDAAEQSEETKPAKKLRKRSSRQLMSHGEKINENIYLCEDGKYRWVYELGLFKTPTIFFLVWKIFFFIMLGIFAFIFLISLGDVGFFPEGFLSWLKAFGIGLGVMSVVVFLGYALYAAMMGGKYIVIFEMDDNGVNHKQVPAQAKKAQRISKAAIVAGLATRRLTTVGVGMNAARTEMYSSFEKTRKVKAYPKLDLIKVNGLLSHNQVYAEKEDFEFVKNYIVERCVNVKGKSKK